MDTTTIKLYKETKSALDQLREERESYDELISKLISHVKNRNLKKELKLGYQKMGKTDLAVLEEWETASEEVE